MLPAKERLSKAKFTKTTFTSEDLLEHLGEKVSSIHFTHGVDGAAPVSVRYEKNKVEVASGGETPKEALAWLVVAVHEHEHPEPV